MPNGNLKTLPIADCQLPIRKALFSIGNWQSAIGNVLDLAQRVVSICTYLIPVALALFVFETPTARHRDSLAWTLLLIGLIAAVAAALAGLVCWWFGRGNRFLRGGLGLAIYGFVLAGVYVPLMCSRSLPVKLHHLNEKPTEISHER